MSINYTATISINYTTNLVGFFISLSFMPLRARVQILFTLRSSEFFRHVILSLDKNVAEKHTSVTSSKRITYKQVLMYRYVFLCLNLEHGWNQRLIEFSLHICKFAKNVRQLCYVTPYVRPSLFPRRTPGLQPVKFS